jgi:hypothetical protein
VPPKPLPDHLKPAEEGACPGGDGQHCDHWWDALGPCHYCGHDSNYIEAPTEWESDTPSIFLAGGITDCPDWQSEARRLIPTGVTVLNPRRENFPIHDPSASRQQIEWEFRHLHKATVVLFWFPASKTSPQPIALYELGRHAALGRSLVVGVEDGYLRTADVLIQLGLARPELSVLLTLEDVCARAVQLASHEQQLEPCPECGVPPKALHERTCFFATGDPADLVAPREKEQS